MFIRPRVVVTSDPPRISPDVGTQKSKNQKSENTKIQEKVRKIKKCKDNMEGIFKFSVKHRQPLDMYSLS